MKNYLHTVRQAYYTYGKELGIPLTFLIITVSLANLARHFFGIVLLPVFEASFDAFHYWCHLILHLLVFSWVIPMAEWSLYGITWVVSLLLPVVAWKPDIVIPPVVSDISLLSAAFTRVFSSTDLIVPRRKRAAAEKATTPEQLKEIDELEGSFWGPIHRFVHRSNARIWHLIHLLVGLVPFPKAQKVLRPVLIGLAGAVLMWGFLRLVGYLINVSMARRSAAPIMVIRRRFMAYFAANFLGACIAVAAFFVLNGWLAEILRLRWIDSKWERSGGNVPIGWARCRRSNEKGSARRL